MPTANTFLILMIDSKNGKSILQSDNPIILYSTFYKEQPLLFSNADLHLQERAMQDVPAYLGPLSRMIVYNRDHHISERVHCTFCK